VDAEQIADLKYPKPDGPIAYVCVGNTCLDPTSDPSKLTELVQTVGG
jgi:hypothetical protein